MALTSDESIALGYLTNLSAGELQSKFPKMKPTFSPEMLKAVYDMATSRGIDIGQSANPIVDRLTAPILFTPQSDEQQSKLNRLIISLSVATPTKFRATFDSFVNSNYINSEDYYLLDGIKKYAIEKGINLVDKTQSATAPASGLTESELKVVDEYRKLSPTTFKNKYIAEARYSYPLLKSAIEGVAKERGIDIAGTKTVIDNTKKGTETVREEGKKAGVELSDLKTPSEVKAEQQSNKKKLIIGGIAVIAILVVGYIVLKNKK